MTRNRPASDPWGVWCTPSLVEPHTPCGGAIVRARWAAGPDGDLVLFETVAKHLAKHFNEVLPGWRHQARSYDAPPLGRVCTSLVSAESAEAIDAIAKAVVERLKGGGAP